MNFPENWENKFKASQFFDIITAWGLKKVDQKEMSANSEILSMNNHRHEEK